MEEFTLKAGVNSLLGNVLPVKVFTHWRSYSDMNLPIIYRDVIYARENGGKALCTKEVV
jgi:hypothetical protein